MTDQQNQNRNQHVKRDKPPLQAVKNEPGNAADKNAYEEQIDNSKYKEETATEYQANPGLVGGRSSMELSSDKSREEDVAEGDETSGKGIGSIGIALSIVSLFFLPIIFAIGGIIFGAIAVSKERRGLGYTAVGIGIFSLVMSLFFAPFVV